MQVIIKKEINYVVEANLLLFNHVNQITYEKMISESYLNFAYKKEIFDRRYEHILAIHKYVTDHMRFDKGKLEYYFREIGNSQMSLSYYLLPIYTGTRYETLKEYETAALEMHKEEILESFDDILSQYLRIGKSGDEGKVETFENLLPIMDRSDINAEERWKIIQAYIDRDKHIGEVCAILDRTIQLLTECRDHIGELEQEFYDYWADYTKEADLLRALQEYTNVIWKSSTAGTYIVPSIFNPQSITFNINDEKEMLPDLIRLGVILDSNLTFKHSKIDGEKLNTALKLLSDKSKFEILKLIKDKPAYGYEIANALNLSTSTISYHMNALITSKLIKIEKDANKIYYSLNEDTVNQILEDIRSLLLSY
jgi:DNA-binding transcriptional ArsR family regulator